VRGRVGKTGASILAWGGNIHFVSLFFAPVGGGGRGQMWLAAKSACGVPAEIASDLSQNGLLQSNDTVLS
jgi:hypothetical protein